MSNLFKTNKLTHRIDFYFGNKKAGRFLPASCNFYLISQIIFLAVIAELLHQLHP